MKLSVFLTIVAVVAFIFGILFILIPGALLSLYGISLSAGGQVVARLFGAALLGYSVLTWCARKAEDSEARKAFEIVKTDFGVKMCLAWVKALYEYDWKDMRTLSKQSIEL